MIVIRSIDILYAKEGKTVRLDNLNNANPPLEFPPPENAAKPVIHSENIHGERFINKDGEIIVVGWSKEVQQALGLPFEAFQNQKDVINSLLCDREEYLMKFNRAKNMTIWERLKFLFLGSKIFS